MEKVELFVYINDDYRSGPNLFYRLKQDPANTEFIDKEPEEGLISVEIDKVRWRVYLILPYNSNNIYFLKEFNNLEEVHKFCETQYAAFNKGDTPFYADGGFEGFYKPTGKRGPEIEFPGINKDDDCEENEEKYNKFLAWDHELTKDEECWLFAIKDKENIRKYSLNLYSVWYE